MLLHTLHGGAALRAEQRAKIVVAALDRALQNGADIGAGTAGHVVGCNVRGGAARRAQTGGEAALQVEQHLGDVKAVIPQSDVPFLDRLRDELILRVLQEIFEEDQMF